MVSEVRIYVEGGGDGKDTKALLRQGFHGFLRELILDARRKRIGWRIVACGSRNDTFKNFLTAVKTHTEAFNILLVDAEGPVSRSPKLHLIARDGWQLPDVDDVCFHLMVQTMETWIMADVDTLSRFYGQGFNANAIPRNPDVEQVSKEDLATALTNATRSTSKGKYHKTRHAPQLLEQLDVVRIRKAAAHCERLFSTLESYLVSSV